LLPLLYIKLGLMTDFVKLMDQTGLPFRWLTEKFQGINAEKFVEGVFIGPQISKFFRDVQFNLIPSGKGNRTWNYFRIVAKNILGNNKADTCNEPVENLLFSYEKLRCNVSLKIFFSALSPGYFFRKLFGTERWEQRVF
jgi:hypothetical protein